MRGRLYWSCTQWYLNDTQVATLSVTQQVPINITHYHTMNHRRFVSLLLVIPMEKHAAMALVHPPYHGPRMRIGALQRRDFMSAAPSMNNHELFGGNVVNIPPREEGLTPDRWARAKFASNTSLLPKRQSIRKSFFQTITPLLFVMLRKIALGSSPAWAATKSSAVAATSASSEWGRYADKPAARGMALSLLLLKLLPFDLLPNILEKIYGKIDPQTQKYKSSRPHALLRLWTGVFSIRGSGRWHLRSNRVNYRFRCQKERFCI